MIVLANDVIIRTRKYCCHSIVTSLNPFQLIENECFKFEEQICDFEDDSTNPAVPEDMRDAVFAAIGKARLLMAQKLAQFRGLCDKNIVRYYMRLPSLGRIHQTTFFPSRPRIRPKIRSCLLPRIWPAFGTWCTSR